MVYVFGHKNPDTDSVCASIAYAYLLNKLGIEAEPRILGAINDETKFVLNKFNVDTPAYLNDVKVRIKDVYYRKDFLINEEVSVLEAFNYMIENNITGLPLIDDDKKFKGYVSLKEIAYSMIYNEDKYIETPFDNIVKTLESNDFIKIDNDISGYAHAATYDDITFIEEANLDDKSILIMGNRLPILEYAIKIGVKLIILVKGTKLDDKYKEECIKHNINIIVTNKSSFKVARLLCLANPIKSIKRNQEIKTFKETDYLTDFEEVTSKLKHTNYPILNNNNECLGMLRTIDAHEYKKQKVVLVDHNMAGQSVDGLYEAEIMGIIDHHNIGDINTSSPINFRNSAVGATDSIIYALYKENNVEIPSSIAGLMLSGVLSDTLLLQSPTTKKSDIDVAESLANIANLDIKSYGLELLSSGVKIDNLTANDIIFKDFKTYKVKDETMAISQVFTTTFEDYRVRMDEIIEELNKVDEHHNYIVTALFITNFLTNESYILYSDNSYKILSSAFLIDDLYQGYKLTNVVSRKQQIVPNIMNVIERI